ncbi:MAG: SDR family NAD(P)-dependent oxidoreductase [Nannocystaceae bacterium]|nr:SDR family NAD(P)-dependent oxidoreductase [bacterium]
MELRDAVVWLTGASDGIGHALVQPLVAAGARVVVTARRKDPLESLQDRFGRERVVALPGDLMDTAGLERLHARACQAFGHIDVLINNAGRSQRATALDTEMDEVRGLMELNFMVPVALTKLVVPAMLARGRGCVVVVGSVAGYVSTPMRSTYNASKFAVRGWFDALRAELHGTGVGVSIIVPGYIRTSINKAAVGSGRRDPNESDPVDSGLPPERCASVIVDAIARDRPEVHVGGKEIAAIHLSRWLPGVVRRIAHRFAP